MVSRQSAAEGLLVLGIGHSRGSRCPLGAMHESWSLLGGVGALHEVRGFLHYAQLLASSPRGSWSSRPGRGRLRPWRRWGAAASSAPWLLGIVLVLVGFGGRGGGRLTESGTAFGARNLLVLQMTEVVP